ncbi:hypothetical protein QX226_22740 [Vibrio vulnificus]|uniref:hypothetical protein n=1 Tax=Vibrio TaxID=662 RepID=UPI001A2822F9|nr:MULTISPECIES: hypothetical protein [Vibrio]ELA7834287.1 hypothetical protein [Vibrio alginolyticus]EGR0096971.1 hypothetical protein [Vibrio vulnificus]MDS1774129.1 hypothetical protein [Vibrio vulnificus]MDS1855315.1 hypothetical protein [Vibrio vulnificus]MDW1661201.1 hypothetical protein [Vibrio sp. Vb2658]
MAVTVTENKKQEWDTFVSKGGNIEFEIDSSDISSNLEFETYPSISPNLESGFELPPTSMISTTELQAQIMLYGSDWDQILAFVYLHGGKVIYKKVAGGKYKANCSIPEA